MTFPRFFTSARNLSNLLPKPDPWITWKPTGKLQQTLASEFSLSGTGLHSGAATTAKLLPAMAGEGRFFLCGNGVDGDGPTRRIPASIGSVLELPLCTALSGGSDEVKVRTVEHLLSALEATGVDNCEIRISGGDEVPILDGSSNEWFDAIKKAGLCVAKNQNGNPLEKMHPFLNLPVNVWKNDSFIAAFPSPKVRITYGIDFPQVTTIGQQWFSCSPLDDSVYDNEISSSRTFCILEEIEKLRWDGLIKGGSLENAIICSARTGWLNPPLRFSDEPCRHKVLDLIGDLSLFSNSGNQGLPVAHVVAYKAGHSLHAEFVRRLSCLA